MLTVVAVSHVVCVQLKALVVGKVVIVIIVASGEAKRVPQLAVCITQGAGSAACSSHAVPLVRGQALRMEKIQAVRALHGGRAATAVGPCVAVAVAVFATLPLLHCLQMASYYYFFSQQHPPPGRPGSAGGRRRALGPSAKRAPYAPSAHGPVWARGTS